MFTINITISRFHCSIFASFAFLFDEKAFFTTSLEKKKKLSWSISVPLSLPPEEGDGRKGHLAMLVHGQPVCQRWTRFYHRHSLLSPSQRRNLIKYFTVAFSRIEVIFLGPEKTYIQNCITIRGAFSKKKDCVQHCSGFILFLAPSYSRECLQMHRSNVWFPSELSHTLPL